jgi:hypothetical protein
MADWDFLTASKAYLDVINGIKERDVDCAKEFDGSGTNLPVGAIRWVAGLNKWQKKNASGAWVDRAAYYDINVAKFNGKVTSDFLLKTDASFSNLPNKAVKRNGSGDINVRLLRSNYSTINPVNNVNFVMTQVEAGGTGNNYVRPTSILNLTKALIGSELFEKVKSNFLSHFGLGFFATDKPIESAGTATKDSNGFLRVSSPSGGSLLSSAASITGAIKVSLPVGWTSHMLTFELSIYDYASKESFKLFVCGYNYSGGNGAWINTTAFVVGSPDVSRNFNVRFGFSAGKCCFYVGETNSQWSYLQVSLTNVSVGFQSANTTDWAKGWNISIEDTAFDAVSSPVSADQIGRTIAGKVLATQEFVAQSGSTIAPQALSVSGDTISIHKSDGTKFTVPTVSINSYRALHSDALRQSGANIQLVKANGSSEVIAVGNVYASTGYNSVGSVILARHTLLGSGTIIKTINQTVAGSLLTYSSVGVVASGAVSVGTWRCLGYINWRLNWDNPIPTDRAATLWKRIS